MLESIASPRDLKALTPDQLPALASEIRQRGGVARMINVTVRQHDRFRPRAGTESRFRRCENFAS